MHHPYLACGALAVALLLAACDRRNEPKEAIPVPVKQKLDGIVVTTLPSVPGWTIAETRGMWCQGFGYSGNGSFWEAVDKQIEAGREQAGKLGANAWVNVKTSSSSFEVQGSKWHSSVVQICGDLVVLQ